MLGALTFAWLTAEVLPATCTLIVDFERTTNPLVRGLARAAARRARRAGRHRLLRAVWVVVLALLGYWGVRSVRAPAVAVRAAPVSARDRIPTPERSLV